LIISKCTHLSYPTIRIAGVLGIPANNTQNDVGKYHKGESKRSEADPTLQGYLLQQKLHRTVSKTAATAISILCLFAFLR